MRRETPIASISLFAVHGFNFSAKVTTRAKRKVLQVQDLSCGQVLRVHRRVAMNNTSSTANGGYVLVNPITGLYFNGTNFSATLIAALILPEKPSDSFLQLIWPGAKVVQTTYRDFPPSSGFSVFVDDQDGDVYSTIEDAVSGAALALRNGAKSARIKPFGGPTS